MSIPGSAEPLLLAQQDTGYKIERSLRFNSSDSAYLSRTPASAGNRKTWTWSGWVKRSGLGNAQKMVAWGVPGTGECGWTFEASNVVEFYQYSNSYQMQLVTAQVFRDVSAWFHVVMSVDTTQATASDRVKLYINGTQITSFTTASYPTQNLDTYANSTSHTGYIGVLVGQSNYFSGYLADIHFIDGQALTPSSFAETDATTGQWVPKAYSGSYGTNGFQLKFADNSAATATTLGKDTSGNGNNWTPNNLSVTAGAGNDSLVDTPTSYGTDTGAGGEVRGNYATLNPLDKSASLSVSNGNLDGSWTGSYVHNARATFAYPATGKWYYEYYPGGSAAGAPGIGDSLVPFSPISAGSFVVYQENAQKNVNGTVTSYGSTFGAGDVIGVAYDADANTVTFYKNNVSQGSITPTAGKIYFPLISTFNVTFSVNFGQRPFAYTAPSGFKALCDTNLPAPVVAKPSESFQTVLWTGDNTSNRTITTGLRSGFVWIKNRSASGPTHILHDVVRGAGQTLYTSSTSAEVNNGTAYVQQFNATNFLLGAPDSASNASGNSYVGWVWDPGANTVTNTQGSITSQVRANASSGFSVVTYSANTSGAGTSATIGHGLGVAPSMIIVKSRNFVDSWYVYHSSVGNTQFLELQSTAAAATFSTMWNNTSPTSTVFSTTYLNQQSRTYVAYCFAPVAGYSSFGRYTGNGSADGPFVYTGFRPRWILIKSTDITNQWFIHDTARDTYNVTTYSLQANTSIAEETGKNLDILSNGFKPRFTDNGWNGNGNTYIYAAFAESPFQYARAR